MIRNTADTPQISVFKGLAETLICSGDIRDRSLTLSQTAPNFGRFFALSNFSDAGSLKTYILMPASMHVTRKSFVKLLPLTGPVQQQQHEQQR